MATLVHYKETKYKPTYCNLRDRTLPINNDWTKVTCRTCLQAKFTPPKKR